MGCHFHSCQCFLFGLVSTQAAPMDTVVEQHHALIHSESTLSSAHILSAVDKLTASPGNSFLVLKQIQMHCCRADKMNKCKTDYVRPKYTTKGMLSQLVSKWNFLPEPLHHMRKYSVRNMCIFFSGQLKLTEFACGF